MPIVDTHRRPILDAAVPWLVGAAAFGLYVLTRSTHVGGDDTVFALVVDRWVATGEIGPTLLNPHHPVFLPVVGAVGRLALAIGLAPSALGVGATMSSLFAALTVVALVVGLRRAGVGTPMAVAAAAVLAVSGGWWKYATRMEVYTLAGLAVTGWLAVMGRPQLGRRAAAAATAGTWLAHAGLGLLVVPVAWRLRHRWRALLMTLVWGVAVPLIVLVGVGVWALDIRSLAELRVWISGHDLGIWVTWPDPVAAARSMSSMFRWSVTDVPEAYPRSVLVICSALGWIATAGLFVTAGFGAARALRGAWTLGKASIAAVLAMLPLWLVWQPGNDEQVVALIPAVVVLAVWGARTFRGALGERVLAFSALALLTANGLVGALIQTQPQLSRVRVVADRIAETVPADSLLLTVGRDPELRLAVPYLTGLPSADLTLIRERGSRERLPPDACVARWIDRARGHPEVWMYENPLDPDNLRYVAGLGVDADTWRRAVSMLTVEERRQTASTGPDGEPGLTLWRVSVEADEGPPEGLESGS